MEKSFASLKRLLFFTTWPNIDRIRNIWAYVFEVRFRKYRTWKQSLEDHPLERGLFEHPLYFLLVSSDQCELDEWHLIVFNRLMVLSPIELAHWHSQFECKYQRVKGDRGMKNSTAGWVSSTYFYSLTASCMLDNLSPLISLLFKQFISPRRVSHIRYVVLCLSYQVASTFSSLIVYLRRARIIRCLSPTTVCCHT